MGSGKGTSKRINTTVVNGAYDINNFSSGDTLSLDAISEYWFTKEGVIKWNEWRARNAFEKITIGNDSLVFDNKEIEGLNLSNCSINNLGLHNTKINNCNFNGTIFNNFNLVKLEINNSSFREALFYPKDPIGRKKISEVKFIDSDLFKSKFISTEMTRVDVTDCDLEGTNFKKTNCTNLVARRANLRRAFINQCTFTDYDLKQADLRKATIQNSYFSTGNLFKTKLGRSIIKSTSLLFANMRGSNWESANLDTNVVFTSCNLTSTKMREVKLNDVSFNDCNFFRANLNYAIINSTEINSGKLIQTRTDGAVVTNFVISNNCETDWRKTAIDLYASDLPTRVPTAEELEVLQNKKKSITSTEINF